MSKTNRLKPTHPTRLACHPHPAQLTIPLPSVPQWLRRSFPLSAGHGMGGPPEVFAVCASQTWVQAELQNVPQPKALVRFVSLWKWDGEPALLMSRAVDETGYVQPTVDVFRRGRGPGTDYHFNHIRGWQVAADGNVTYGVPA